MTFKTRHFEDIQSFSYPLVLVGTRIPSKGVNASTQGLRELSLFRYTTKIFVYYTVYIQLSFLHPPPTYSPTYSPTYTHLNMRVNEEEIPSVSDTAPKAVQKLQRAKIKPLVLQVKD